MNSFIVETKGQFILSPLIVNSRHSDYKVCISAQKILIFVILEQHIF